MTPILGEPCSYHSTSHKTDFEDLESGERLQLPGSASITTSRRKKKFTQRAKYNLLKGEFVNCITKKSFKRKAF